MLKRWVGKWSWSPMANYMGVGSHFKLTVPVNSGSRAVLQGMEFNPKFSQIEIWGYMEEPKPEPPIHLEEKRRDFGANSGASLGSG
jgi:hypothetical protein